VKFLPWMLVLYTAVGSTYAGSAKLLKARDPIANEYIVVLNDQTGVNLDSVVNGLTQQHGGAVLAVLRHGVKAFGVRLSAAEADRLADSPLVNHVEENGKVFLSYTVQEFGTGGTDASWWHLDRIDNQGPLYSYHAYAYTTTGSNVNAYTLDTGVLASHNEFSGPNGSRVRAGTTFGDGNAANNPCPTLTGTSVRVTHGTSVASIIGGTTNGVAKNVMIVPVKVFNCDASNGNLSSSTLWWCWGLDWILSDAQSFANANYRAVVNISGGINVPLNSTQMCDDGHGGQTLCIPAFEHDVATLVQNGITVVTAANNFNNGNCDTTPARMGYGGTAGFTTDYHAITVGGSSESDQRWVRAANEQVFGDPDTGSNFGTCVDIYAPAHNFQHLASLDCNTCYRDPNNLFFLSGTSYAAPVVTGIVARLLQTHPTWTPVQIWNYIHDHATGPACFDWADDAHAVCRNNLLAYISPFD